MTDRLPAGDAGAPAAAVPAVRDANGIPAPSGASAPVAVYTPIVPIAPSGAAEPLAPPPGGPAHRSRWQRAYLGKPEDPRWARPALLAILALSAALYLWNLSGNGYANEFYAAAVQAGTKSWSSAFFGSLDTGNFITVDKPPFALWVMEASTRVFGFSSLAMLLPIALCGVAAVGVLYSAVRRTFGHAAGAVAALVAALTPITVAINRDNNPDPVLVLLMTLGAWFTLEAMRTKRLRHLLWAAVMIGCAFNTKMLQAYIVLPALVLAYLYAAEGGFWRRIRHLAIFTAVLAAASFWWMLIVDAIPSGSRPYVGGSTNDSVWDLVIGYNGLGRITGSEGGPGGGGGASFSGSAGLGRLFNDIVGTQVSWLLPAAAILCVAAVVLRGRAPRTDPVRAALVLWGLWLAVHFVVFSYQQGTMHPYYVTTLGPAIGALLGGGGSVIWRRAHEAREAGRGRGWAWLVLPIAAAVTGIWSIELLDRTAYATWLVPVIAIAAVVAIGTLVAVQLQPQHRKRLAAVGLGALLVAGLAGPSAFAAAAANSTVNGTNPLAGPSNGSMGGPGGGFGGAGGGFGDRGDGGFGGPGGTTGQGQGRLPSFGGGQSGQAPGQGQGNFPSFGGGQGNGAGELPSLGSGGGGSSALGGGGIGMGGGLSTAEVNYLLANQGGAKWLLAVSNSNTAASLELQTGKAVISMFGFTGSDNAMTVDKLEKLVAAGELKYVELGGGMGGGGLTGGPGGGTAGSSVQTWVEKNCTAVSSSALGGTSSSSGSSTTSSSSGIYACTASSASASSTTA
jgi:4-amino-4-deoxy-L-arabinose transferase-like glycosyltransferase